MTPWEILPNGVTSKCSSLFGFPANRAAVEAALGPPQGVDLDSNGIGPIDVWALRFPCGREVRLWFFKMRPDGSMIEGRDDLSSMEVQTPDLDIDNARHHLPLSIDEIWPWERNPGGIIVVPRPFLLVRQDDNGNRFEVKSLTSRCEAQAALAVFEALGHKQTYWLDSAAPQP